MYRILRRVLITTISIFILLSTFGICIIGSTGVYPKGKNEIAGHNILKILNLTNNPDSNYPRVIFQDSAEQLYISKRDSLSIYQEKENYWRTFNKSQLKVKGFESVYSVVESPNGKIWISSKPLGDLRALNSDQWEEVEKFKSNDFFIDIIFPSRKRGVWVSAEHLLYHFDGMNWSEPISAHEIIWENKSASILSAIQDKHGLIWLGIKQGVVKYDESKKEWSAFLYPKIPMFIRHIYEDANENLWFANEEGDIAFYERKTASWSSFKLSNKIPQPGMLYGILEDGKGQMLFATKGGLGVFDKSKNKWSIFTPQNSGLLDSWVTCVYKDRSDRIWIGTPKDIVVLEP